MKISKERLQQILQEELVKANEKNKLSLNPNKEILSKLTAEEQSVIKYISLTSAGENK